MYGVSVAQKHTSQSQPERVTYDGRLRSRDLVYFGPLSWNCDPMPPSAWTAPLRCQPIRCRAFDGGHNFGAGQVRMEKLRTWEFAPSVTGVRPREKNNLSTAPFPGPPGLTPPGRASKEVQCWDGIAGPGECIQSHRPDDSQSPPPNILSHARGLCPSFRHSF